MLPQANPAPTDGTRIDLVLDCLPPAHVLSQVDQDVQSLITQSTSQVFKLHAFFSSKAGHEAPPLRAGVTTVLVRVWVPGPQGAEQSDHAPHSLTTQSTEQGISALQLRL